MTLARTLSILLVLTSCIIIAGTTSAGHWNGTRGGPDRNSVYPSDLDAPLGIEWYFEGNGELRTPLINDDTAYVSSMVRKVYAVDLTNGSEAWASSMDWFNVKNQEIIGDRIYIASKEKNRVLNMSLENGTYTSFSVPGGAGAAPIALGPYLMVVNSTHLLAYRNDTLEWEVEFTATPSLPATDGDKVFLRAGMDLYSVDEFEGIASITLSGSGGSPTFAGGMVYIGTDTMLYEIRPNLVTVPSI